MYELYSKQIKNETPVPVQLDGVMDSRCATKSVFKYVKGVDVWLSGHQKSIGTCNVHGCANTEAAGHHLFYITEPMGVPAFPVMVHHTQTHTHSRVHIIPALFIMYVLFSFFEKVFVHSGISLSTSTLYKSCHFLI